MTPEKIANMTKKDSSNKCWKCQIEKGTLYHMWWLCQKAKEFWDEIYKELQKIFKGKILKSPELFLLGLNLEKIDKQDRTALRYLLTAARIQYARYWR